MWSITMACKKYKTMRFLQLFVLVSLMISCGKKAPKEIVYAGNALGTTFQVKYFDQAGFDAEKGIDSVFVAINRSMSTYLENSDISKINKGDSTLVVDDMFVEVFKASQKIYLETHGYFDPTVGKMVNFYGFGPEKFSLKIDSSNIDSLMEYVGFDKVELTPKNTVQKADPTIYLDFNAIAKGYAVDRVATFLDRKSIQNYLVEIGGELYAKGKNLATKKSWTVGIDDPNQTLKKRTLSAVMKLKNRAMATSGNYRKFRIDPETGKKYVHTIDPLTGYPAKNSLLSATVLAKNCMLADAYATSLMAMGLEKSKEFLKTLPEIDAYLIYAEKDSVQTFMTEGFEKQLLKE